MPIRVYLMSRLSLVLPFGKIVRFLLTFPFVGSIRPVGRSGQYPGVMFTLGYGDCLEFPTLTYYHLLSVAHRIPMVIGTIPIIPQWIPRAMRAMMAVPLKMSIAILSFISCSFLITLQR